MLRVMIARPCSRAVAANQAIRAARDLDKTGLTGEYDFALSRDENVGPDLATAQRERLGFRFHSC